jgi:hypothetical protein
MHRRTLITAGLVTLAGAGLAHGQPIESSPLPPAQNAGPPPPRAADVPPPPPPPAGEPARAEGYSRDEIVNNVSDFLGVTAEAAGAAVERLFAKNGRPTGYIAGEEGSGSLVFGARYGRGLLYMKGKDPVEVYWQGPSVGFDWGGNASRVFTLCYDLMEPQAIYQRFPGVEGSAYLIGGLGVNYQKAGGVTLAPMRAGVGLRLGANVGYLSYSKKRHIVPF